ncbi:hypothetical protein D8L93_05535 [Sodalis-like symbiont of Bactericera trigonica]|nr:hypothetical protein D8L93_05535 [Sodalis-like symbiont of Bactericera trigonica]
MVGFRPLRRLRNPRESNKVIFNRFYVKRLPMSAKDDLYRQLSAFYHQNSEGFTTLGCERFTSASRSVISLYLNQPCDDGFLRK